ncbi:MAG: CarD family transcriptional regulator, partial [Eubacterium sp.]
MYDIGDKIVYPMHGAGVVKAIEEKELFDECQWYYLMEIISE